MRVCSAFEKSEKFCQKSIDNTALKCYNKFVKNTTEVSVWIVGGYYGIKFCDNLHSNSKHYSTSREEQYE